MALEMDVDGLRRRARADAARSGDPAALDAVAAEYLPLVYNIVRRALRRSADVDDVVQETMLRFVRGVASLRDPDRLRAWLVAVTVNQIREHHRGTEGTLTSFDEATEIPDPRGEFVEHTLIQLDVSGQRRETQQASQWLDPEHRELLALWWLEASGHLTRPELIDALRADPHHVAVRISRMKEQLDFARRIVRALSVRPVCPLLDHVAAEWRGDTTSVWRKRFARHVRECERCGGITGGLIAPERLLAGLALLPLPAAYTAFRLADLIGPEESTHAAGPGEHGAAAHGGGGHGGGDHHWGHLRGSDHEAWRRRVRHRGGAHRGGRGAGGKAGASSFITKPVGIGLAAVLGVAVVAIAASQLEPHQNNVTLTTSQTNPPIPAGTAAPTSALTFPSESASASASASPSKAPSTSAKPSVAPSPSSSPAAPRTSQAPATSAPPTTPSSAPGGGGGSSSSYAAQQVLDVINQARAQNGLPPYSMSNDLIKSATAHNERMASGCGLSHQCPGEPALGDRETAAGVQWSSAGENIGEGGPVSDTQSAIAQMAVNLTNSMLAEQPPNDGHRLNILSSSFTGVGIAVSIDASGTVWMTQDFAG